MNFVLTMIPMRLKYNLHKIPILTWQPYSCDTCCKLSVGLELWIGTRHSPAHWNSFSRTIREGETAHAQGGVARRPIISKV